MDRTIDRERWQRISAILDVVLELPAEERQRTLDDACAGDAGLRQIVEELLAANGASGTFLSVPAAERAAALIVDADGPDGRSPASRLAGRTIGAYRIVSELGEGGMGIVCLAERADGHFEQRVAIKLVKHGLFSEEAHRRFLQERRILAHLEHPSIARLLDGGVMDDGMPFFVMEWVNGQPVTSYCAERALPIDDRLAIFLQVCDAVQYAHRNLVVHRDLKPSNILVDVSGRVKLLDFGIAKLLEDGGGAAPAQTIGRALTPEYAAPEQLLGEPVSTTADVYALGVLLHELLTGERPYRLRSDAPGELERAILEQEPLAPSSRVAAPDLRRRLRGDLDRIVVTALQKSPDRRYPSAEAIAADVRRHLQGLPVSAQGDAVSYRARKFLRRHRVGVGAAALLLLTLVAGLAATMWQTRRAEREARKADAVKQFLTTLFSSADPAQTGGRAPSLRQLLDAGAARIDSELSSQPDVQAEVTQVIGSAYQSLGEFDRAAAVYRSELARRRALDGPRSLSAAKMLTGIADAMYDQDRFDEADAMYNEALAIERERRGNRTQQVAELLWDIAGVMRNRGDLGGAEQVEKEALAIYVEREGEGSLDAANVRESLAITYLQAGHVRDAAAIQAPVVPLRVRRLGPDHPATLTARYNAAFVLNELGRFEESAAIAEDVAGRQRRILGPQHNGLASSLRLLARARDNAGHAEDAVQPMAEALRIQSNQLGAGHLQVATGRVWQAKVEMDTGRLQDAERDVRSALTVLDSYKGPVRADLPHMRTVIGRVLAETGRLDEADAQISRAVALFRAARLENVLLGFALDALADVALRRNQPARARDLTAEAVPLLNGNLDSAHPVLALVRVHAGAAQWATGNDQAGERLMRDGLAQLESRFPGGHADLAAARVLLAGALTAKGRRAEARPLLQEALAWREAHFGPGDPRTATVRLATRH